MKTIDKVYDS